MCDFFIDEQINDDDDGHRLCGPVSEIIKQRLQFPRPHCQIVYWAGPSPFSLCSNGETSCILEKAKQWLKWGGQGVSPLLRF